MIEVLKSLGIGAAIVMAVFGIIALALWEPWVLLPLAIPIILYIFYSLGECIRDLLS